MLRAPCASRRRSPPRDAPRRSARTADSSHPLYVTSRTKVTAGCSQRSGLIPERRPRRALTLMRVAPRMRVRDRRHVKRFFASLVGIAALVAAAAAFAAPTAATSARLVSVTSPVARNAHATLVAGVAAGRRCSITVHYKSGPSQAQGLNAKPSEHGRVSWTWMVGGNTTLGTWPITVDCGSAGSFRTHFRVIH